ncbi:hypothetical protein HPP92_003529 [Vanilla planifolia]|uniref:Reticulon-like protein n=1 Tax=Vanilla planifolia TaxID=51239 RepID=A0A835SFS5_VANPL|nr:hypothetical protein HPP92_003529 [Vanilla planifolia]
MPPRFVSEGRNERPADKLFGRRLAIHQFFGGGRVADIVLWREKHLSGAILAAVTAVWFLFGVVEYPFLTLLSQLTIVAMLLVFIWSNAAALFNWRPPKIPELILSEKAFREFALAFHYKLNLCLAFFHDVAMGKDLRLFLLAIASLWVISVIGSIFSTLNLLYFGYLCIQILPVLYERYEGELDHLASKGSRDLKKLYSRFDADFLNKIPRGPVKEKKYK